MRTQRDEIKNDLADRQRAKKVGHGLIPRNEFQRGRLQKHVATRHSKERAMRVARGGEVWRARTGVAQSSLYVGWVVSA